MTDDISVVVWINKRLYPVKNTFTTLIINYLQLLILDNCVEQNSTLPNQDEKEDEHFVSG